MGMLRKAFKRCRMSETNSKFVVCQNKGSSSIYNDNQGKGVQSVSVDEHEVLGMPILHPMGVATTTDSWWLQNSQSSYDHK